MPSPHSHWHACLVKLAWCSCSSAQLPRSMVPKVTAALRSCMPHTRTSLQFARSCWILERTLMLHSQRVVILSLRSLRPRPLYMTTTGTEYCASLVREALHCSSSERRGSLLCTWLLGMAVPGPATGPSSRMFLIPCSFLKHTPSSLPLDRASRNLENLGWALLEASARPDARTLCALLEVMAEGGFEECLAWYCNGRVGE